MAEEAKLNRKKRREENRERQTQSDSGWDNDRFYDPQIVNTGTNFLLLVHSANEVSTWLISHFHMLQTRPTKPRFVKLTTSTELASLTPVV